MQCACNTHFKHCKKKNPWNHRREISSWLHSVENCWAQYREHTASSTTDSISFWREAVRVLDNRGLFSSSALLVKSRLPRHKSSSHSLSTITSAQLPCTRSWLALPLHMGFIHNLFAKVYRKQTHKQASTFHSTANGLIWSWAAIFEPEAVRSWPWPHSQKAAKGRSMILTEGRERFIHKQRIGHWSLPT